jgi:DDE superfamily endonuclease
MHAAERDTPRVQAERLHYRDLSATLDLRCVKFIIADNLSAHKAAGVQEAIAAAGARLLYLPPYSPDLNLIERCWSTIKTFLHAAKARTRGALDAAVTRALVTVTASDARAWFAHSGYVLH